MMYSAVTRLANHRVLCYKLHPLDNNKDSITWMAQLKKNLSSVLCIKSLPPRSFRHVHNVNTFIHIHSVLPITVSLICLSWKPLPCLSSCCLPSGPLPGKRRTKIMTDQSSKRAQKEPKQSVNTFNTSKCNWLHIFTLLWLKKMGQSHQNWCVKLQWNYCCAQLHRSSQHLHLRNANIKGFAVVESMPISYLTTLPVSYTHLTLPTKLSV